MNAGFWVGLFALLVGMMGNTKINEEQIKGIFAFSKKPFYGRTDEEIVQRLKNWGVNAVFCGYDDPSLVATLREQGVKVLGEFSCFVGEAYWEKYPDAHPVNEKGEKIKKVKGYAGVCPNHPGLREEKLDKLRELVRNYDLDGVWLDFIRYPCHWEVEKPELWNTCFCKNCLFLFQKDTGISVSAPEEILGKYRKEWMDWRCARIVDFVREVRKILDEEKPRLILGLFGVPWKDDDYDNAIEWVIGQRYEDLAKYVDVFSPMVYHRMCGKDVSWTNEFVHYLAIKTEKRVVPIVQAFDAPTEINSDEFEQVMGYALKQPSGGAIVFGLKEIVNKNWEEILQHHFK